MTSNLYYANANELLEKLLIDSSINLSYTVEWDDVLRGTLSEKGHPVGTITITSGNNDVIKIMFDSTNTEFIQAHIILNRYNNHKIIVDCRGCMIALSFDSYDDYWDEKDAVIDERISTFSIIKPPKKNIVEKRTKFSIPLENFWPSR